MAPQLEQSTFNTVAKYQSRTCTATFTEPTTPGNLIVVAGLCAGALPSTLVGPPGFTLLADRGLRDLEMAVWYRQNAPATTSVTVGYEPLTMRSIQVRAMEYSGMAQANILDQVSVQASENYRPYTGQTGVTSQADALVLGFIGNQYASAVQSGFLGALVRLFESVSPQGWFLGSNQDWERSRLTVHQAVPTSTGRFSLSALLSSTRRWIAFLVVFKGASSGPARFTSTKKPMLTTGGGGALTVFGPLKSIEATPAVTVTGGGAVMLPFNYQFRLPNGLLIGQDTPYTVLSHDGLYGHEVRSSDEDQPRGDGSLRGVDLQTARQILFEIQVSGTRSEIELRLDLLYRALVPQRDQDWPLVWRHPALSPRLLNCRPIQLPREIDQKTALAAAQKITLRAADPRHYSAVSHHVEIPVSPATGDPVRVNVFNDGNVAAYPVITIRGPSSGPAVNRVELVNETGLVTFDAQLTLPKGSTLTGDMNARIIGAPRSVVTLDGQSKYGSWQLPRSPFRIDPDPTGRGGYNVIYLQTDPPGAPVLCTLDYRSTWSG